MLATSSVQTRDPGAEERWGIWFGLLLLLVTAYRLAVIPATGTPIFFDEAYYYYWSLHPDFGYYSKPPMVALVIGLTTALGGDTVFAIKAGAALLYGCTATLIFFIAARLYDRFTAFCAGAIFLSMPLVGVNSLFISTDAPLLFFWASTLWLFLLARDQGHWYWWLTTGIAAGLGLQSKYTMGLLAPSLAIYLLFSPQHRHWLRSPRLWVGVAVAALVFLPNLVWNYQHDFASFRHTAHISELERELFHPDHLLEFLGGQFGVFGPIFMVLFVLGLFTAGSYRDDRSWFMLAVTLPTIGLISLQALLAKAYFNWAGPAYVGAAIFVAALPLVRRHLRWLALGVLLNLVLLSGAYHYHWLADRLDISLRRNLDPYFRMLGWPELAAEVSTLVRDYPDARLLGEFRPLIASLSYYMQPKRMDVASWNPGGEIRNHYDLVADVASKPEGEFLFVSQQPLAEKVLERFERFRYLGEAKVTVYSDLVRQAQVYWVKNFKGYR